MKRRRKRYHPEELTSFQKGQVLRMVQMPHLTWIYQRAKQKRRLTIKLLWWAQNWRPLKCLATVLWPKMTQTQSHSHANMELSRRKIQRNCSSECFAKSMNIFFWLKLKIKLINLILNLKYFRFSPCASKPIKQRVEAFEKLQTPQKETRTRAKVLTDSEVCLERFFFRWNFKLNIWIQET